MNVLANVRGQRTRKNCCVALFSFHSSEPSLCIDCIELILFCDEWIQVINSK